MILARTSKTWLLSLLNKLSTLICFRYLRLVFKGTKSMSRLCVSRGGIETRSALLFRLMIVDVTYELTSAGRSERFRICTLDDFAEPMLQSPKFNSKLESLTIDVHTCALHCTIRENMHILGHQNRIQDWSSKQHDNSQRQHNPKGQSMHRTSRKRRDHAPVWFGTDRGATHYLTRAE